jgi:hypothetical protein
MLLGVLALGACEVGRRSLDTMCVRECERAERAFEAIEACRSGCRDAYRPPPAPADENLETGP